MKIDTEKTMNMKSIKKLGFLAFLLAAMLLTQNAFAVINDILPESTHYEGSTYYNDSAEGKAENMHFTGGHIDFAVYDTSTDNGQSFESTFGTAPGIGQYIYAYQIFADEASDVIDYFGIAGIGEGALTGPVNDNIGSLEDDGTGISPDDIPSPYIGESDNYGTMGIWEFSGNPLEAGEHSWFLVLRSDHDWTSGYYTLDTNHNDMPAIPNPEPSTIALLGFGSVVLLRKRRKSVRRQ